MQIEYEILNASTIIYFDVYNLLTCIFLFYAALLNNWTQLKESLDEKGLSALASFLQQKKVHPRFWMRSENFLFAMA